MPLKRPFFLLATSAAPFLSISVKAIGDRRACDVTTRDELPLGYCHQRTSGDDEFVRRWNEAKVAGRVGQGPFNGLRRSLGEVTTPPPADSNGATSVCSPGEYEQLEGLLLAYDSWDLDVVAGIANGVTKAEPPVTVYMVVESDLQENTTTTAFVNAGANMARVEFIRENIDAVWIRDYGPRFTCDLVKGDVKASVDTRYYSTRPNDDALPKELAKDDRWGHDNYDLNRIMHSGGNMHFFSDNKAFASSLLLDDNDAYTEEQLINDFREYKGVDLHLFPRLARQIDGTGHIDMWFLPVDDTTVIIGEFQSGEPKTITDNAALYMQAAGYTVYRVPNWNAKNTHYTYTNAVIANDVVVMSKFNVARDSEALAEFQKAFPDKTIYQVDSSDIITRSGALHCIAQHVFACDPATCSGLAPVPTCSDSSTCPDPASDCEVKTCSAGQCGTASLCGGGQTCAVVTDCASSPDCSAAGCTLKMCGSFSGEGDCVSAGCKWKKGNGPSSGCSGSLNLCEGTPDVTGPTCF